MKNRLHLVIVSSLLTFVFTLSGCTSRKSEYVIVPDVRGKKIDAAIEEIKKLNLLSQTKEGGYYTSVPEGYIVTQSPYPYTKVRNGRTIYLEVSKGISKVIVPNIINLEYSDGKKKINDLGLNVGQIIEVKDIEQLNIKDEKLKDAIQLGMIVAQDPPEGTEVYSGSKIIITVWIPELPLIPNLIDIHFEDAKKIIKDSGFILGTVIFKENHSHPRGAVIQQEPIANSKSQIGAIINLIINEKP